MRKNNLLISSIFLVFVILLSLQCSAYLKSSVQGISPGILSGGFGSSGGQWIPDRTMCEAGQDFVVQIEPFGCEPAIVRSDLLEEQNVPVFCQLSATKMNPFIDVNVIDSISFSGATLPNEISGVGFYPAQAALGVTGSLNSPVLNNIGYAVIVLKKQINESSMPEFVSGNLTARLQYDIKKAYGIGDTRFYLPEISDDNIWKSSMNQYGFWNGRGYLRADSVSPDAARISLYTSPTNLIKTVSLNKGEESTEIYLPGFDCFVGAKLRLDDLVSPDTRAVLNVNGDVLQLVNGEKFLENKCTLNDITRRGLTRKVDISCTEDEGSKRFTLVLTPKVSLNIGGTIKEYAVGDYLYEGTTKEKSLIGTTEVDVKKYVYLGYVGTKGDSEKKEDLYVMLVSTSANPTKLSESEIAMYAGRAEAYYSNIYKDKAKIIGLIAKAGNYLKTTFYDNIIDSAAKNRDIKYIPVKTDEIWNPLSLKEVANNNFVEHTVLVVNFASPVNSALTSVGTSSTYYQSASQDYSKVRTSFAAEKDPMFLSSSSLLGEESFVQNIRLADTLIQKGDVDMLCKEFEKTYPSSTKLEEVKGICKNPSKLSSATSSSITLSINAKQKIISLEDIRAPGFDEYGVRLKVTLPDKTIQFLDLVKDKTTYVDETSQIQYAQLLSINKDVVSMNINKTIVGVSAQLQSLYQSQTVSLTKGKPDAFGTPYIFEVVEIYDTKNAKISIIPTVNRAQTEANFTFHIGIEKRAIQLSPEQTKQIIKNLNETIAKWKDINEKLGKVVEGMNAACLATGLTLTLKNFISNVGGMSIARQEVMTGEGGWNKKCANAVSTGLLDKKPVNYKTPEQCIMDNSPQIDKDVDALYSTIQQQDAEMKILQEKCPPISGGFLKDTVMNTTCIQKEYSEKLYPELEKSLEGKTFMVNGKPIAYSDVLASIKANEVSIEDMRKIQLYARTGASGDLSDLSKKELDKIFANIYASNQQKLKIQASANKWGVESSQVTTTTVKESKLYPYSGLTFEKVKEKAGIICVAKEVEVSNSGVPNNPPKDAIGDDIMTHEEACIKNSAPVAIIVDSTGKEYLGILEKQSNGKFYLKKLYQGTTLISESNYPKEFNAMGFEVMNQGAYTGRGYKSPVLRCYETEPYKGVPAITPVNTKDGWYAAISQTLPAFGNIGSVDKSGRVVGYKLCNVWENGMEENKLGDDMCTDIYLTTGQAQQVGGLDATASKKLIDEAGKAVEAAQKACKTGKAGDVFNWGNAKGVKMGAPAVDMPDMQCTNFMSPSDCKILFNVCDPVICPNSRCNFGGDYPVKNVIQSGIVGSILLCLKNFVGFDGGDVYIPVCLSGLRAGIEGLLSVFEGYRDCLQTSLDTGQMTGICDEVFSVHLCNLLWENAVPFAKMIVPKTIEWVMGKSTRGGGEYLSVQSAWTAAGQSVDYFAQFYAAESYAMFKQRIVQGVTSAVCKTYISGAAPDGNFLSNLIKAKSPVQFTGRFDEIPFTTATNPPISQYKVYFHIYAGTESRAYYQVYLTDVAGGSYYQDTSVNRIVDSGYIPQGGMVDKTPDFTAISGYKKMCIIVNGQQECGFKQVSTSFALDYVADQYVKDQASQTSITSESDCVAGTSSAWSLASPSLGGAASELVGPQIYNRGIIRICANENPGSAIDKDSTKPRWVSVGYCGRQELKCWLDTESVKSAVNFNYSAQTALNTTLDNFLAQMKKEGKYLDDAAFIENVKSIANLLDNENYIGVVTAVNNILNKVSMNAQKGKLYLLRASAYGELAKKGYTEALKTDVGATTTEPTAAALEKCTAYLDVINYINTVMLDEATYPKEQWYQLFLARLYTLYTDGGYITIEDYNTLANALDSENVETSISSVLGSLNSRYDSFSCEGSTTPTTKTVISTSKECVALKTAIDALSETTNRDEYTIAQGNKIFEDTLVNLLADEYLTQKEYSEFAGYLIDGGTGEGNSRVLVALKNKHNTKCITEIPITIPTTPTGTIATTKPVTASEVCTAYSLAIKQLEEKKVLDSKYSDTIWNTLFVEKLKTDGLITFEEYTEIKGGTLFNWQETMQFVLDRLNNKFIQERCPEVSKKASHGQALSSFPVSTVVLNKISIDYGRYIESASIRFSVDENLIKSIIYVESSGYSSAIGIDPDTGKTGGKGVMQLVASQAVEDMINPTRGRCYSKCFSDYKDSWKTDPEVNIMMGTCYLACVRDVYKIPVANNDWTNWITGYGPAGPSRFSPPKGVCYNKPLEECARLITLSTVALEYAGKVLKVYETLTGISQTEVSTGNVYFSGTVASGEIPSSKIPTTLNTIGEVLLTKGGVNLLLEAPNSCEKAEYTIYQRGLLSVYNKFKNFKDSLEKNKIISLPLSSFERGTYNAAVDCYDSNGNRVDRKYSKDITLIIEDLPSGRTSETITNSGTSPLVTSEDGSIPHAEIIYSSSTLYIIVDYPRCSGIDFKIYLDISLWPDKVIQTGSLYTRGKDNLFSIRLPSLSLPAGKYYAYIDCLDAKDNVIQAASIESSRIVVY